MLTHTHIHTHIQTHTHTGGVMGYSLCALSLMTLYCLCLFFRHIFETNGSIDYKSLFECVAGYGLGGSAIAMFGRVGGGIFTKVCVCMYVCVSTPTFVLKRVII